MTTFHNPRPPVDLPILGNSPGTLVKISGCPPYESKSFTVSLLCYPEGHTALQISTRFDEKCLVMSTIVNLQVRYEERDGIMVIQPGRNFELVILFCEKNFKIGFNGEHFSKFKHRVPYCSVTNLGIEGDVIIHSISFEQNVTSRKIGFVIPPNPNYDLSPGPAYQAPYLTNAQNCAGYIRPSNNNIYPPQMGRGIYGNRYPLHPQQASAGYAGGYPANRNQTFYQYPQSSIKPRSGLLQAGMTLAGVLGTSVLSGNKKAVKKQLKSPKKAVKYGLPLAGAGIGAYALSKGLKHGFRRSSSSSSSSD